MCLELKIILFLNLDQRDKFKSICLKIISDIRLHKKKKKHQQKKKWQMADSLQS